MSEIINPTKEQIDKFCEMLKGELHSAFDRGSDISLGVHSYTKDVKHPDYGQTPIDVFYVGGKFVAKFRERGF